MSIAKQFEKNVATQLKAIKDTYVYRLSDLVNQFGVANPCDYFCFYKNTFFLLEMKTTEGASLPLKNISDYQYSSMLEASNKKGIKAYFLVWWYSKDLTRAIPISVIKDIKETNKKSIRYDYKDSRIIEIDGVKKKLYFEYDWNKFFKGCVNSGKSRITAQGRTRFTSDRGHSSRYCGITNKRVRQLCTQYKVCIRR